MSDDLFKCKRCGAVKDKDEKNGLSWSKWSTKATTKAALCDECATNFASNLDFKFGEWKAWPKRGKNDND